VTRSTLSELLQERRESYEAESTRNKELIAEWVQAIERLFAQLCAWLETADPERILQVEKVNVEVHEPNVGHYLAPRLNIRAFGKWIGIIPKARKTVGTARPPRPGAPAHATGRVDITDEIRRYVLYRFEGEEDGSWFVEGPLDDSLKILTQELFEEALMSYF
jgi:hypothetical protein